MAKSAEILYQDDNHLCLFFTDLVSGEAIPSNQLVIVDQGQAAIFDPGGELTYTPLSIALSKHVDVKTSLKLVFASHQDPDIITSLPRWLMHSDCRVVTSKLWGRFLPHLVSNFVSGNMNKNLYERLLEPPDTGAKVLLGNNHILAIPAHFLHSVGNFHFYDPVSKILFSGDVGAAITPGEDHIPVTNMEEHIPKMEGFHRRYMASNKAAKDWVARVRGLDIETMVPQHGRPFKGKDTIEAFYQWFEQLDCGVDLL